MENGEIVERGTHDALLAADGRYRQLYDKQYKLETNRFVNPGEDWTPEESEAGDAEARRVFAPVSQRDGPGPCRQGPWRRRRRRRHEIVRTTREVSRACRSRQGTMTVISFDAGPAPSAFTPCTRT